MIRNLLLDPKPCGTLGLWTLDNGNNRGTPANMAFTQDGLTLTGHETTGSAYTVLTVHNVPEGHNTLSFRLRSDNPDVTFNANGGTNNVAKINRGNWAGIYDIRPAGVNRTYAATFNTTNMGTTIIILFFAPTCAATVTYDHMMLCTEEEHDMLDSIGIDWFSGQPESLRGVGVASL